jgi:Putative sensor
VTDGRPSGSRYPPGSGAAGGPPRRRGAAGDTRLRRYRNPLRLLLSASPWLAAGYLAVYVFLTGWALFSAALTATVTAACFAITLAGIPLLAAAAAVLRGCANIERGRLRRMLPEPVPGGYREVTKPGIVAEVRTRWHDTATWHDVAYLIGLWLPLFVLDTIVFSIWLTLLAGIYHLGGGRAVAADHHQPVAAGRVQHLGGGADHRHGGRRRLLAVLPAP